ncbi:hypothetical protein BFS14_15145 [Serratia fonticola]|uniref:hypothetical protein n=1 Tax=Serratia fonticola TaxID=47917 RepID=UPI0008FD44FE|nr:hypothetical protein [Serratia fonticola]OIX95197.1 hypothetical protein BFS14_15145 [Serratia fonticola]QCR63016.1 hypothetical protein FD644_22890 [Serratia fonticola]
MNTHTFLSHTNVKTTHLRMDGFVRNLSSRHPFDVIRADVVLERMEKQASTGCGLHDEIYEAHLFDSALNYLATLQLKDRPVFMGAAATRGYVLTLANNQRAQSASDELLAELRADY